MLIDCFTFFNELDILEIRLNELNPYVDYFVLVEANKTQSLIDKPFYFEENKQRFAPFLDKIIHVKVEDCPMHSPGTWTMENFQRNCIERGLRQLNVKGNDSILISDVDEIPNLSFIGSFSPDRVFSVKLSYHVFYANLVTVDKFWTGTVVAPYRFVIEQSPQGIRNQKDFYYLFCTSVMGWHLGYMGGKKRVYEKFHSCIEPMDKSRIQDYEGFSAEFDRKIRDEGSFLFSDKNDDSIKLKKCDIQYPNLPLHLVKNQPKYRHLLLDYPIE